MDDLQVIPESTQKLDFSFTFAFLNSLAQPIICICIVTQIRKAFVRFTQLLWCLVSLGSYMSLFQFSILFNRIFKKKSVPNKFQIQFVVTDPALYKGAQKVTQKSVINHATTPILSTPLLRSSDSVSKMMLDSLSFASCGKTSPTCCEKKTSPSGQPGRRPLSVQSDFSSAVWAGATTVLNFWNMWTWSDQV